MEPNKISFMIFGYLYNFILIKQNWLTIKNKKLFLILYEKEEANWPSTTQRGRGPRAEAAHGGGAHARWHFYKRDLILAPNYITISSLFLSLSDHCT